MVRNPAAATLRAMRAGSGGKPTNGLRKQLAQSAYQPRTSFQRLRSYTVSRLSGDAVHAISGSPFVRNTRLMPWRTNSWISSSSSKAIRLSCRCASLLR